MYALFARHDQINEIDIIAAIIVQCLFDFVLLFSFVVVVVVDYFGDYKIVIVVYPFRSGGVCVYLYAR